MLSKENPEQLQNKKNQLFLIDGYGFVFRAYHSLPPLTRPDGTPVGAVYGFTNMIMKIKSKVQPDNGHHMLVVFDSGRKTFRNDIYPKYKANRPPAPEDLIPQFPLVREAAEALGLPISSIDGYEADDIIATYAKMAKAEGMKVTIVSSDKDLMQLIDDDVEMYDAMKDKRIGPKEVFDKFGVMPDKVLDVLSLMGDSSDNVPGVPGIGPKTAAELITTFGSLDDVLARTDEIKQQKRRESLKEFAEQARLSRELIKLCETAPVTDHIDTMSVVHEVPEKLLKFLREQGFKSLITKIESKHGIVAELQKNERKEAPEKTESVEKNHKMFTEAKQLAAWLEGVRATGQLSIYPVVEKAQLLGFGFAKSGSAACFVPISHTEKPTQTNLFGELENKKPTTHGDLISPLYELLEDESILKIGHDIKSVMHLIERDISPVEDTLVMSYVLDGSRHKHDLNNLAQLHLGESPVEIENLSADREKLKDYVCDRACLIISLQKFFRKRLFAENMLTLYENIERPLISVLAEMENNGVRVDSVELRKLSGEFTSRIAEIEKDIFKIVGHEFNVGSPKQLGEVLFGEMNIEGGKKSKLGAYSTGADILEELSIQGHTIADKVLEWRMLSKLKSTYADALVNEINPKTGRIHTTFAMTVASTGRLSSINPNLQNIPIRTEEGRKIRSAFIAEKGNVLVSADYSQIELRLLAHLADIETLKDAFRQGHDIHAITASQVFGVPLDKVDAATRRNAKTINFGIIYGQSAFGLAKQLGIGRKEAAEYIEAYFKQYPGIKDYMEKTKEVARAQGYVTTVFGRKCFVPEINDKNPARRQFAERAAINAPLQGTAADIIKKAMVRLSRELKRKNHKAKMILQIHDELLLEAPEAEAKEIAALVKKEMEGVVSLSVPVIADAKVGNNWGAAH